MHVGMDVHVCMHTSLCYVCIYVCMDVCAYVYMCVLCVYMYCVMCVVHVCVHACVCMYMCVCPFHVCVHVCASVCMSVSMVISSRRSETTNLGRRWRSCFPLESDCERGTAAFREVNAWCYHLGVESSSKQSPL